MMTTAIILVCLCTPDKPARLTLAAQAVWYAESNCQLHPPSGDGGRAVGPLQIWRIRVDDCNRIAGYRRWEYDDRLDLDESIAMFVASCLHYWPEGTIEQWCRHWNGSPTRGPTQTETLRYWQKCRRSR